MRHHPQELDVLDRPAAIILGIRDHLQDLVRHHHQELVVLDHQELVLDQASHDHPVAHKLRVIGAFRGRIVHGLLVILLRLLLVGRRGTCRPSGVTAKFSMVMYSSTILLGLVLVL